MVVLTLLNQLLLGLFESVAVRICIWLDQFLNLMIYVNEVLIC